MLDFCRNANGGYTVGQRLDNHGIGSDANAIADGYLAEYFGPGAGVKVIADGRPIAAPAPLPNDIALHQCAMVSDDGCRAYHGPLRMIENQPLANCGKPRDLSAGEDGVEVGYDYAEGPKMMQI